MFCNKSFTYLRLQMERRSGGCPSGDEDAYHQGKSGAHTWPRARPVRRLVAHPSKTIPAALMIHSCAPRTAPLRSPLIDVGSMRLLVNIITACEE